MKRLLATLAIALGLGLMAAPAQAATDDCDQACVDALRAQVEDLTDENTELRSDVDWLTFKLMIANAQTAAVEAKLAATQTSLDYALGSAQHYQGLAVQRLAERDAALALADARLDRILTLRAKVKELRLIVCG
jgi:hypothetical protein